jgi:hypothetical protein
MVFIERDEVHLAGKTSILPAEVGQRHGQNLISIIFDGRRRRMGGTGEKLLEACRR